MVSSTNDRRLSQRRPVALQTHYGSTAIDMSVSVTNLSRTGLFLSADILDDPGSMVALTLKLPTEPQALAIAGKVVRVDLRPHSSGMGIRFTDLSVKNRQRLARFMEIEPTQRPS